MSEPAIARLVGEGVERPEAFLPLDINYAKLTEWLVTRQKIPKDWHKRLQVIQAKANEAFKDLPADVTNKLTEGSDAPLDYLRAVEIRDQLASTAERTMFGGLSGAAAMWDKIVKAYEKQYIFLGECGQTLVQNVDFEIPYLRRHAAKLNQTITDCERKYAECLRNAATCASKHKEECKKLGIAGVAVRHELRGLASELPGMLREVVKSLHDPQLQSAAEYYAAFTRFAHAPRSTTPATTNTTTATTATNSSSNNNTNSSNGSNSTTAPDTNLHPASMLPTLFEIRAQQTQPPPPPPPPHPTEVRSGPGAGGGGGSGGQEGIAIDWDLGTEAPTSADGTRAGAAAGVSAGVLDIDWDAGALGEEASGAGTRGEGTGDFHSDAAGNAGATDAGVDGGGGDGGGGDGGGGGINWDIDFEFTAEGVGEGDNAKGDMLTTDMSAAGDGHGGWGGGGDGGANEAATAAAAAPIAIDWEIELEAVGDGAVARDITSASGPDAGGERTAADGPDGGDDESARVRVADPYDVAVARLERDGDYRARLLDDLLELRAFLAQRKAELSSSGGFEFLRTSLPESVSSVDAGAVGAMLGTVQRCLGGLHSQRFRQLLLIATSTRYLDRLEASLQRQAGAEAKLLRAAGEVKARQHEARGQLVVLAPRVGVLVARSRRLKAVAERSIAAALGGKRTINVLGEINNVLAAA